MALVPLRPWGRQRSLLTRSPAQVCALKLKNDVIEVRMEKLHLYVAGSLAHMGFLRVPVVGTFLRTYSCPAAQETANSLPTNCAFEYLEMLSVSLIGAHSLSRES